MSAFSCFSTNTKTLPILIGLESRHIEIQRFIGGKINSYRCKRGNILNNYVCNILNNFPRLASVVPFGALRQYLGGRFCVVQSRTLPDSFEIEGNTVPIAKGYKVKKQTSG